MDTRSIYPVRSPLMVAEVIAMLIKNKVFCDVGCGNGDLLEAALKYAKNVNGIEWNTGHQNKHNRPDFLNVIDGDVFENNNLPEADIYYIWVIPSRVQSIIDIIPTGKTIILGDYDSKPDLSYPIENGLTIRFPFNERGEEEWFRLTIIKK